MASDIELYLGQIIDEFSSSFFVSAIFSSATGEFIALEVDSGDTSSILYSWEVNSQGESKLYFLNEAMRRIDKLIYLQDQFLNSHYIDLAVLRYFRDLGSDVKVLIGIKVPLKGRRRFYAVMLTDFAISELTKKNLSLTPPPSPKSFKTKCEYLRAKGDYLELIKPIKEYIDTLCSVIHIRTVDKGGTPQFKSVKSYYALNKLIAKVSMQSARDNGQY